MPDVSEISDNVSVTARTRYVTTVGLEVHAQKSLRWLNVLLL